MKNFYRPNGNVVRHATSISKITLFFSITWICFMLNPIHSFSQVLPTGFNQVQVATGLSNPTIMTASPDGRIFIAQQNGVLRVFKNGALLATPFITLSVNSSGERGLLGIAFDPNFARVTFITFYYY